MANQSPTLLSGPKERVVTNASTNASTGIPALHNPQRGEGETYEQYRARRQRSQEQARRAIGHGLNGGTNSRETHRNAMRASGTMSKRTRAYVALTRHFDSKRISRPGKNKRGLGLY